MSNLSDQTAFDNYWTELDEELTRYPAAPELEPLRLRSTEFATVYALRLTSVGPYRIFGYYSVPHGDGPFPGLLVTPRYGSVNHLPHYDDRKRYAVLVLMHRGQRLADQPFQASYPGLLTLGIDDPDTYIYRGIVADCLRGAEFLLTRPEVDPARVAITGDDLALMTAARRPQFTAAQISGLLFYRMLEACARTEAYPLEEINDYLRTYPERQAAVARTLSFFDPQRHADKVTATTLLTVGDPGALGGPEWLAPLNDALGDHAQPYMVTHEGGTDTDWIDAWLAERMGVEPMPRLWEAAR
ncbi:MAG TPA: acetylxylan esterase [Roseiflexaceae bacterium]|nr:acetylxylan esterase [Roseiflexaceae bacterium]